ncbi:tetratricopeptide repeat protein [Plantactinospora sp. B24E8]|uniref:AfsR/SARP family transcriptional regulator n=1 Tax=Plantactinospora sp. B24E8 TaxID=3153567 RepID=UPI00325F5E3C
MTVRIQVLGPMRAWYDDQPVELGPPGRRAVLGLLVLAGGQLVTLASLVDAIWGETPPASAVNILQTHVKHLRRLLEPNRPPHSRSELLPYQGEGYRLCVPADQIDLLRFRRLVRLAAERETVDPLVEALALWQGPPFADLPLLARHPRTTAVLREHRTALTRYAGMMLAAGAADRAITALEEAVAADPLDEAGQALLVRAYGAAGRRAQGFAAFHTARRRLADELGVDPGPELAAAYTELLDDSPPGLDTPPPTAVAVPRPVPAELPADVAGFTGRGSELAALDRLAGGGGAGTADTADTAGSTGHTDPASTVVVLTISGTAGVGKTALATRWAHRARNRFPDGQLYLDLRGYDPEQPVTPGDALARFLRSLGLPGEQLPTDLGERAARYRSLLDGRRMLILLDNAASVDQVRPLLPGASAGSVVLVTSRDSLPGLVVRHGARRLDLDVLTPDNALALLRLLLGDTVVGGAPDAAAALVAHCAGLPLALRIAAELVHRRAPTPLATIADELADHRRRLDLLSDAGDSHSDIGAVFSWSYRDLPTDVARTFRLLGTHPGPEFEAYAVTALTGVDAPTARAHLELLGRSHLVQRRGPDRYGMHDLLRAYARDLAARDREAEPPRRLLDLYLHTAATAIDVLYPAERHRRPTVPAPAGPLPALPDLAAAVAWLDAERANLVATAVHATAHRQPWYVVPLTVILLRYLESGGHYPDAVILHEHALRAARDAGDRRAEAQLRTNLGVMQVQQSRYPEAVTELTRAIELAHEVGDTVVEARALGNLGHVYQWQGRYPEAAASLTEAVALCRRNGDQASETRALGNLGQVRLRQQRYAEAARHLEASIAICRRVGDQIGEAYALVSLGHVDSGLGRHQQAGDHHQRALALFRSTTESAGEAYALDGLARVDLLRGEHRRALDRLREALALFQRIGERAGEACVGNSLGEVAAATGRFTEARMRHLAALRLAEEIGSRHEQARARTGLAHSEPDRGCTEPVPYRRR